MIIYLDGLLSITMSRVKLEEDTRVVLNLLRRTGFLVNVPKSSLEPSQVFLYLGLWWNLVSWTISLAKHRVRSLRATAKATIRAEARTCRQVAVLVGKAQSSAPAVPLARARIKVTQES